MKPQKIMFESGNELAAYAAKQINYHVMGYYPITPSTQIAEELDRLKAEGGHETVMIPADGEHGAAGICYGAAAGGGRVINATSANGLLYALEQLPVQSGTRLPMVLNVACRTVSGPLSIKGDQSDIMYALNTGWIILYAQTVQAVYDFNICALKIAEKAALPIIVAFDGFFTSHQKRKVEVFENDGDVRGFIGEYKPAYTLLDAGNPVTVGAYMNEPDLINNKFQLHMAMEEAKSVIPQVFGEYSAESGRSYGVCDAYRCEGADVILFIIGSAFETAKMAVDKLRGEGKNAGAFAVNALRPWPADEIIRICGAAKVIVVGDRQDSYGAGGGNLSIELKAALQGHNSQAAVISRVYGLSGKDFYPADAEQFFNAGYSKLNGDNNVRAFDYYGVNEGDASYAQTRYFEPVNDKNARPGLSQASYDEQNHKLTVKGGLIKDLTAMQKRVSPGHGACPGCGIPVNVNLLLKGIEGSVVLLFHTGCGMVVTTPYPKTAFRTPYIHNLFQNGAATLSGLVETYNEKRRRGELPGDDFTFVMITGDGGLDIGMGPAIGAALRNHGMIIFEYDNGGYMNTGYQLSYSTPMGASSATSHVGEKQKGKINFHKDNPQIMAATNMPYVATVAESNPADFIRKAVKAAEIARRFGTAYIKALSACPLNWGDDPRKERSVIEAAVNCCYHPLYEVEFGVTSISYDPEEKGKKIPVADWFSMMGRTKHMKKPEFAEITESVQHEIDRRWARLKAKDRDPLL